MIADSIISGLCLLTVLIIRNILIEKNISVIIIIISVIFIKLSISFAITATNYYIF